MHADTACVKLGAIRYERDVRGIVNFLATQTSFGGPRDKFTRLQQIATVINMDAVSGSRVGAKGDFAIQGIFLLACWFISLLDCWVTGWLSGWSAGWLGG